MSDASSYASTDLTFFTNEEDRSLEDRFRATLEHVQFFDVLVGYFRYSGFHRLYEALENVDEIRILIGLATGRRTVRLLNTHRQQDLDFASHDDARNAAVEDAVHQLAHADDRPDVEQGLRTFLRLLADGTLQLRTHPKLLHAKVYIGRYRPDLPSFGHVVTGSSNFSESGLIGQREFNVELKDRPDVEFALDKFEALWDQGVEVTEDILDALQSRTWLTDRITPYDLYLKLLYEYFQEDIQLDQAEADAVYRPEGFLALDYQEQAVTAARKILDAHNGVFIADVVGLGKTYVTAMLVQQLRGRTLVVCPPVLEDYWRDTFIDFGIRGYRIVSLGKLDAIVREGHDKYNTVVLDEAHRFRNELTQRYETLHRICFGKQVVCVSATPLNNDVSDIYSLLKLFQTPRRSTIPGVRDLKAFFKRKNRALNGLDRGTPEYVAEAQAISDAVRDRVLKHVMVRRTRSEIETYYTQDLEAQGLSFPTLQPPQRIVYAFDADLETVFQRTIDRIQRFSYARYTPLLYAKGDISPLQRQSQQNIGGFMKTILVKRLESSFHAFRQTLDRFITSYEQFIELYDEGVVYMSKDVDVFDLLNNDREDRLLELIEEDRVSRYAAGDFRDDLRTDLKADLDLLYAIQADWQPVDQDPKRDAFLDALASDEVLATGPLLVFTEAAETGRYLFEELEKAVPGEVLFYCSDGGRTADGTLSPTRARRRIRQVFDPTYGEAAHDESARGDGARDEETDAPSFRVLITTDVLAEGINLHRSNTVVNYDLPWNPTRVLQRVGRVNRVGTAHDQLYVYNFFPTAQADAQINLEANIKTKIQAFHDTLGEDAQYLSDDEEVTTHELFGDDLYDRLNDPATYEGEADEGPSELKYLQTIRTVRDEEPDRFAAIRDLPKKARLARRAHGARPGLLTFFRRKSLKRFFHDNPDTANGPVECTFLEVAQAFECEPDTPAADLPDDFYTRLHRNKEAFDQTMDGGADASPRTGGQSNEDYVRKRLRAHDLRHAPRFTEADQDFLQQVDRALSDGILADQTVKRLKSKMERTAEPLKVLQILRDVVPAEVLDAHRDRQAANDAPREVILSEYLLPSA